MFRCLALFLAACAAVNAYQLPMSVAAKCRTAAAPTMMAGKGFGKAAPPPPPKKKKSAGAAKRDAMSSAMDELTSSGSPEYTVLIRTVDASGVAGQWMPVGGLAVPRSTSEDMALSMAIFNNEDVRHAEHSTVAVHVLSLTARRPTLGCAGATQGGIPQLPGAEEVERQI